MKASKSELAWRLADYKKAGLEPPMRCISNPDLSEGEMMTADEVEEFIKDSIATLRILADKKSPRFDEIAASYKADLAYLVEVGSVDEAEYNDLTNDANLRF
ncbi:MAG TPA: hypothetical protein VHQ86_03230 [Candidatus Saccharimonadia bacterium]|nr:hypothetical protein [Candidatus Saccharimonadia bacterium]